MGGGGGKSGGASGTAWKAGGLCDGADRGLGLAVARLGGGGEQRGAIGLGMAAGGKRDRGDLPAEPAALPGAELESRDCKIFPRAIAELRRNTHFRALRFPGAAGPGGLPAQQNSLRWSTHWHVRTNCQERSAATNASFNR